MYKQERLDSIIEDLEITDDLTKKSKIQIVKLVICKLDEKLEAESEQEQKIELLKLIRSKLLDAPPPLEMDETEKQMLALEEQYAALKAKQDKEMKELEAKLAAMKKTSGKAPQPKTPQEIQTVSNGTVLDLGSSLLRHEFKISGQIGEPGQTEKLTFVSLMHQIDSGLKRGYQERDIVDAIIRSISPRSSLRSYVETLPQPIAGDAQKSPPCTLP